MCHQDGRVLALSHLFRYVFILLNFQTVNDNCVWATCSLFIKYDSVSIILWGAIWNTDHTKLLEHRDYQVRKIYILSTRWLFFIFTNNDFDKSITLFIVALLMEKRILNFHNSSANQTYVYFCYSCANKTYVYLSDINANWHCI